MKHRLVTVIAVFVASLTITGSALAFDCMRVSSSMQGLQHSASNSGMWVYFDMTNGDGIAQILEFGGITFTSTQLGCLQDAYTTAQASDSALPSYFALGNGVAGAFSGGPGVLAYHNKNINVLSNGTGIDHLDATVLPVLEAAAPACGLA